MSYNSFSNVSNGMIPPPPNPPLSLVQSTQGVPPTMDQQQQQLYQQQIQAMQQQYQLQMQQMQQFMGPGVNDQPLDFNPNKHKPPIIHEQPANNGNDEKRFDGDGGDRRDNRDRRSGRDRDRRDRNKRDRDLNEKDKISSRDDSNSQPPLPSYPSSQPPLPPTNMPMMPMGGMMGGVMGGMMGPGGMMPMMDPAAMMGQYGMMTGMMPDGDNGMNNMMSDGIYQQRSLLEFKECTLVPPSQNACPPATRDRPPGCRTVYVGGLPDNITEDIIRDVFGNCGEMISVRLSKKNFCHIRFVEEDSVDAAMMYSGYRMRIGNNTDAANTGRLHVDYAQARVDQYEYECKQRALQREQRHRERMERDRTRPASPPPVPHFTDHEAGVVAENMKSDEGFKKSAATVVAWLERGDLSKRNANSFYSMIQSTYGHVRRLLNEKMQHEEELRAAKDLHRARVQTIIAQFEFIEKVFTCASLKKCWDHFTKAQRKNIEAWKKQSLEIKQLQLVDFGNEEGDTEMDVSDEELEGPSSKKRAKVDVNALRDENDSLTTQLEAYKNEVAMVKAEFAAEKDLKIKILQQQVENLQKEVATQSIKLSKETAMVKHLQGKIKTDESVGEKLETAALMDSIATDSISAINDKDAKLIGLIATFLHVHPFGAGVDYIWSYLSKLDSSVKVAEVEALLGRFNSVFRQDLCGIGATLERRWIFTGFKETQA